MSIDTILAAAATQATTQPSAAPTSNELALAMLFTVVALIVAALAGALHRYSAMGPMRLEETDAPVRILAIAFLGLGMWFGISGTYLALMYGQEISEARQRNLEFTLPLRENATVNAVAQLLSALAMLIALHLALRDGARKIGYRLRDLPAGVLYGIIGACVAVPLTLAASIFITKLWFVLRFTPPESHQLIQLMQEQPDRIARWIVILSAALIAPLFEETLFRGCAQTLIAHAIRRSRGMARPFDPIAHADAPWIRWTAICTAALVFAVIHEASWMMPPLFVLAVCFGYVYERTGKLWAPIVMHMLFNATSLTLAFFANR